MARKDVEDLCNPSEAHPNSKPKMGQDLGTKFPKIAAYWYHEKNRGYLPEGVRPKSNNRFWWYCGASSCDHLHVWKDTPGNLIVRLERGGEICPFCNGSSFCPCNSLMGVEPELCKQWDHQRNPDPPTAYAPHSNKKVWWICSDCEHSYERAVSQTRLYRCPCCAGLELHSDGRNSLERLRPDLVEEWHPTNNGNLSPKDVGIGYGKKVWWKCTNCDHEWENLIRVKANHGCPYCVTGRLHSDRRNSLLNLDPGLSSEIHPDSLKAVDPNEESGHSRKRVKWLCKDCSHEWETTISSRFRNQTGCPCCDGQVVHSSGENSMRKTHPKMAEMFHIERNNGKKPDDFLAGTNKKLWWKCVDCDNEWEATGNGILNSHKNGLSGCGYCNKGRLHSDGRNSMRNTNPLFSEEFDASKNGKLTPDNIIGSYTRKLWWICSKCDHEFYESPEVRIKTKHNCPYCAGVVLHTDKRNSISNKYPQYAIEFDMERNKGLLPSEIKLGTNDKLHWICSKCQNRWEMSGSRRKLGQGCPTCNRGALHSDRRNSLLKVNPTLAEEWHPDKNGGLTPDMVTRSSHHKVWWICKNQDCKYVWEAQINNRARTGCPKCVNVGFQIDKPAYYYVLEIIKNEQLLCWKGGISSDFKRRLRQHELLLHATLGLDYELRLVETEYFEKGIDALNLENKLLQNWEIRSPDIGGFSSELFIQNPLEFARETGLVSVK